MKSMPIMIKPITMPTGIGQITVVPKQVSTGQEEVCQWVWPTRCTYLCCQPTWSSLVVIGQCRPWCYLQCPVQDHEHGILFHRSPVSRSSYDKLWSDRNETVSEPLVLEWAELTAFIKRYVQFLSCLGHSQSSTTGTVALQHTGDTVREFTARPFTQLKWEVCGWVSFQFAPLIN